VFDVWEDDSNLYGVLEYLGGGEMFNLVARDGAQAESRVRDLLYQVVEGHAYMLEKGWVHRDLSLENVLLDESEERAVIIDLGLAHPVGHVARGSPAVGKPRYWSPQVHLQLGYDGGLNDVWCMGVMMYLMLMGNYPYTSHTADDGGYVAIYYGRLLQHLEREGLGQHLGTDALHLMARMLTVEEPDRICPAELHAHPWIAGASSCSAGAPVDGEGGGEEDLPSSIDVDVDMG
jgi:serine/threonine protein kinase